jgi:L-histidine Nalpha-methyltransferase
MATPRATVAPLYDLHPAPPDIAADVVAGLAARPRTLPSKYFYDARGSRLFQCICGTPEYYLARAELAILRTQGAAIADALGAGLRVVEYGVGDGEKTRLLLAALHAPASYLPVELSRAALQHSVDALARHFPRLAMVPVCADFTGRVALPSDGGAGQRTLVYLAGSTLGNFVGRQALTLLRRMRDTAGPGGFLLLGLDLKKDPARLRAAYNDAAGYTAAFTLNLLARLNRELHADFDLAGFVHRAEYSEARGRIETDLVSCRAQTVHVAGHRFHFDAGEALRVECSCKYDNDDIDELARETGLRRGPQWRDPEGLFALQLLQVPDGRHH